MKDQIFVSYSRDQLYYAESIAHTLQKQNFNIWFDLQRLAPGTAWASGIESALQESSRIILIASRSSLQSPYVAIEWMNALERHKPIYILLFEEVEFKAFTTDVKDEMMLVPLDKLRLKAKAIIDGRGNFKKSVRRLSECLTNTAIHKDSIPSVNRFKIPQRLPLPVAFIAVAMAALTALTLILTFTIFSAYIPMMIVGLIATAYGGLQTWEFLQRKSYQGTRVVLAIAPGLLALFAFWFTPIAIGALCAAMFSDDVHRWSPRGEGNNPRDLILRPKKPVWRQILPFLIWVPLLCLLPCSLWLIPILLAFVRNRNSYETHRRGDTIIVLLILSTLLTLIEPLVAMPLMLVMTVIAHRRQKPIARTGSMGEVTYTIHAESEDAHIVEDIRNALEYVGLNRLSSYERDVAPDYHIVVLSNFGDPPELEELKAKGGKIIVVLASSLTDAERVKAYSDYQWVDYRRQEPEHLLAMARDLAVGKESNSFHTRIVPQGFERLVIPARVFLFTLVQLVIYSTSIFRVTRSLVTGEEVNLVLLMAGVISLGAAFWIVERILDRRITVSLMTRLNVGIAFSVNILALLVGLMQPRPAGVGINTQAVQNLLWLNVVSIVIFYWIGLYQIGAIMKWWLPPLVPPGKGRRNKQLVRVVFVSGLVTALLTISFFGADIPVSHEKLAPSEISYKHVDVRVALSLEVPDHWVTIPGGVQEDEITPYVRNAPISAVLLKADGPWNRGLALSINSYFQSPYNQSLIIATMHSLGGKIERTFDIISLGLDSDSSPWKPYLYGFPAYTTAYVPGGKIEDILIMTVWSYNVDTPSVSSVGSVVTHAREAPNTQPVHQGILTANITGFNSEITTIQLQEASKKTVIVMSLDTSNRDYYVTISGPYHVLQENQLVLQHILESIRV